MTNLSIRTGGPTYSGYETGNGRFDIGPWFRQDSSNLNYQRGHYSNSDPLVFYPDPLWSGWIAAGWDPWVLYQRDGNIIKAKAIRVPAQVAHLVPSGVQWLATWISMRHSVNFRPQVYIEAEIRFPSGPGPWFAFWTLGCNKAPWPNPAETAPEVEADVAEFMSQYGDFNMNVAIHGHDENGQYHADGMGENVAAGFNVTTDFHRYGVLLLEDRAIFSFDRTSIKKTFMYRAGQDWEQWQYAMFTCGMGGYGGIPAEDKAEYLMEIRNFSIWTPPGMENVSFRKQN